MRALPLSLRPLFEARAMMDKRERFIAEYLVDMNATQAAIRAGYSPRSAYSQGQRLLKNAEVAKRVLAMGQKAVQSTVMSVEQLDAVTESIVLNEDNRVADRLKALELMYRRRGALTDKHEVDVTHWRAIAEQKAQELGLNTDDILAEAQRLLRS